MLSSLPGAAQVTDARLREPTTGVVYSCDEWNSHFVFEVELLKPHRPFSGSPVVKVVDDFNPETRKVTMHIIPPEKLLKERTYPLRMKVYVYKDAPCAVPVANRYLAARGWQLQQRCPDSAEEIRIFETEQGQRRIACELLPLLGQTRGWNVSLRSRRKAFLTQAEGLLLWPQI